jgi:protein TonB
VKRLLVLILLLPAVALAQDDAPPPSGVAPPSRHTCGDFYPDAAKKGGIEGMTRVSFHIAVDGTVKEPQVAQSSGNADLDAASLVCVRTFTYRPAIKDGKPIEVPWQINIL